VSEPSAGQDAIDNEKAEPGSVLTLRFGFYLLAISVPAGLTLEALHALKVEVYLGSALRRELWTLAHAHANLLGILCLVFAAIGERWLAARARPAIGRWLRWGSVLMPLGFFAGGVLNSEGDPSLGIVLVPVGGVCLLVALVRSALAVRRD
jgi:hypothetical protein